MKDVRIETDTMKKILALAKASSDADKETLNAIDMLMEGIEDDPDTFELDLIDRKHYDKVILWNGEEDIKFLLEECGTFEEEIQDMSPNQVENIVVEAANNVDWEDIEDTLISHGNAFLSDAIETVLHGDEDHTPNW